MATVSTLHTLQITTEEAEVLESALKSYIKAFQEQEEAQECGCYLYPFVYKLDETLSKLFKDRDEAIKLREWKYEKDFGRKPVEESFKKDPGLCCPTW
jgi:hypothetical protein